MRFCGDPEALVSALEKLEAWSRQIPLPVNPAVSSLFIVEPLTDFSLENIFSAHPTTEARVTSPALSSATAFILYGRRKLQGPSKGVWRFLPASLVKVSLGVRRHNSQICASKQFPPPSAGFVDGISLANYRVGRTWFHYET